MTYNTRAASRRASQRPVSGYSTKNNSAPRQSSSKSATVDLADSGIVIDSPDPELADTESLKSDVTSSQNDVQDETQDGAYVEGHRLYDLPINEANGSTNLQGPRAIDCYQEEQSHLSVLPSEKTWEDQPDEHRSPTSSEPHTIKGHYFEASQPEVLLPFDEDEDESSSPVSPKNSNSFDSACDTRTSFRVTKRVSPRRRTYLARKAKPWPPPMAFYRLTEDEEDSSKDGVMSQASYHPNVIMATKALVQHERRHGSEAVPTEKEITAWLEDNKDDFVRARRNVRRSPSPTRKGNNEEVRNRNTPAPSLLQAPNPTSTPVPIPEERQGPGLIQRAVEAGNQYVKRFGAGFSTSFGRLFTNLGAGMNEEPAQVGTPHIHDAHEKATEDEYRLENEIEDFSIISPASQRSHEHHDVLGDLSDFDARIMANNVLQREHEPGGAPFEKSAPLEPNTSYRGNRTNTLGDLRGHTLLPAPAPVGSGLQTPGTFALRYDWSSSQSGPGSSVPSPFLSEHQKQLEERRHSLRRKIEAIGSPKKVPSPAGRSKLFDTWDGGAPDLMDWDYD